MFRGIRRHSLSLLVALALILVYVPPAAAAGNWNLLNSSSRGGQGGSGGKFEWQTKYKFTYFDGVVEDYCPPDDWGVAVYFNVQVRPLGVFSTDARGYNHDGCDTLIHMTDGKVSSTKKIYAMSVVLYFVDNGQYVEYGTQSNAKLNPLCC